MFYFSFKLMAEQQGVGPDIFAANYDTALVTIGFALYSFEGIGIVMPVLQCCSTPDRFIRILISAMCTLTAIYILFGTIVYLAFGSNMTEPISTEILPKESPIVLLTKTIFCFNLIISIDKWF